MNDSLADIFGIIVDGGTIVYVGYKAGHRVWKNRDKLTRRMIDTRCAWIDTCCEQATWPGH